MNAVIIFDVSENKEAVLRQLMQAKGYYLNWTSTEGSDKKFYNLPFNVVWKPNTELQQALDDLNSCVDNYNIGRQAGIIRLLRCIVLNSSPWKGINGEQISIG